MILKDLADSKKSDHIYLMPTEIQKPGVPAAGILVNNCGDPSISSQLRTTEKVLPKNSTPLSKQSKRPLVIACVILTIVITLSAIVSLTVLYINEKDKSDANTKENNLSGSSTNSSTSTTKRGLTTQTTTGALNTLETSLTSTTPGSVPRKESTSGVTTSSLTTTTSSITTTISSITTTTPSITTTTYFTTTTPSTTTTPGTTTAPSTTVTTSGTLSKTTVQAPNVSTSDLYRDCKELKLQGYHTSWVYSIYPYLPETTVVRVYCDMTTDGGGWTVFQHRKDGTENFYVDWTNYKSGFGDPAGEYWLGNDHIHQLTALGTSEFYVRLEKFSGGWFYAKYKEFTVASEIDGYRMRLKVGSYQGNAGDSMESFSTTNTNGYRFSTRDVDNDDAISSCAVARKGAWWYNICTWANLNGDYGNGSCVSVGNCNFWYSLTNSFSGVKASFMMVRRS